MSHHYAFVAAKLVEQSLEQIQTVIDTDERSKHLHPSNLSLYDMKEALAETERQLFSYFAYIIQKEVENSSSEQIQEIYENNDPCYDLPSCVTFLRLVLQEASLSAAVHAGLPTHSFYPRRSATDSLLFRLNVALQLCLVRIDDARLVICGCRNSQRRKGTLVAKLAQATSGNSATYLSTLFVGISGASLFALFSMKRGTNRIGLLRTFASTGFVLASTGWLHRQWSNMWMTTKIVKSTEVIEDWNRQWTLIQCIPAPSLQPSHRKTLQISTPQTDRCHDTQLNAARTQRLIEYALHETTKVRPFVRLLVHSPTR